jgi:hypothetical protein
MTVTDETRRLAWVVLQTANRTQARGSPVRLVVPRAPEVARELEPPLGEAELLTVEGYLLEQGYVAPANIGLTWGTYTITPAGFNWLERDVRSPADRLRELADQPGEEAAFESTVRADLEEERRRREELERELDELRRDPETLGAEPGVPESPAEAPEGGAHPSAGGGTQSGTPRPWWRRLFEG